MTVFILVEAQIDSVFPTAPKSNNSFGLNSIFSLHYSAALDEACFIFIPVNAHYLVGFERCDASLTY